MSTRSEISMTGDNEDTKTTNKPIVRKVAAVKSKRKKFEITNAIKASERDIAKRNKQDTDHTELADPKLLYFEDLGSRIAQRAYEIYKKQGGEHGHNLEDWFEAERQILMEQTSKNT